MCALVWAFLLSLRYLEEMMSWRISVRSLTVPALSRPVSLEQIALPSQKFSQMN